MLSPNGGMLSFNENRKQVNIWILILLLVSVACVRDYVVPTALEGVLIIEGHVSNEPGDSEVKITLSGPISNITKGFETVSGANVLVLSGSNQYAFNESEPGLYTPVDHTFNASENMTYQLVVRLSNDLEFRSEELKMELGPEIQDLSFEVLETSSSENATGEDLMRFKSLANYSDPNYSKYYRYTLDETWETRALAANGFVYRLNFLRDTERRPYLIESVDTLVNNQDNTTCWVSNQLNDLWTSSTQSIPNGESILTVHEVPLQSSQFLYRYSANVNQYAISEKAFQFLNLVKTFSEEEGLLFNRQPGQLVGNIDQTSGSVQEVLGLFQVSGKSSKRISFDISDIPEEYHRSIKSTLPECSPFLLPTGVTDSCDIKLLLTPNNELTFSERNMKNGIIERNVIDYLQVDVKVANEGHLVNFYNPGPKFPCDIPDIRDVIATANARCVDCGSRSGLNIKPDWWDAEFE